MNENVYIAHKKLPNKTLRVHSARYTQCIHVSSRKLKLPKDTHTKIYIYTNIIFIPWEFKSSVVNEAGTAQLVERPTEKNARCNMTWVKSPGAARDFSPRVGCRCRLFYGVRTAPVCNRMYRHLSARYK